MVCDTVPPVPVPTVSSSGSAWLPPSTGTRLGAGAGELLVLPAGVLRLLQPHGANLDHQVVQPILPELVAVRARFPTQRSHCRPAIACRARARVFRARGAIPHQA